MALFSVEHVCIKGISAAVPGQEEANAGLSGYDAKELEKLIATLGIEHRRVATEKQCASDLCIAAAEKLIHELNWDKAEISALFFVSQTPDYTVPGSSFHIAQRLGLPESCACFDVNQGCAGYVYGLSLISSFLSSTKLQKGLLLVGDTITRLVSPADKALVPVFSDGGTATALQYAADASPLNFNLSTAGASYDAILIPEGGARCSLNQQSLEVQKESGRAGHHLHMKGLEVFNFSLRKVAPHVDELLAHFNADAEKINYFVFHQANALMLDAIAKKLNLPLEKVPSSLKNYGNTSGASVPITIVHHLQTTGKTINAEMVLCGFGVGLSLASVLVSFKDVVCTELIEVV